MFRFLLVIFSEVFFVIWFSVVLSVLCGFFSKRTCFITFFGGRRRFAVNEFFVTKTVSNNLLLVDFFLETPTFAFLNPNPNLLSVQDKET